MIIYSENSICFSLIIADGLSQFLFVLLNEEEYGPVVNEQGVQHHYRQHHKTIFTDSASEEEDEEHDEDRVEVEEELDVIETLSSESFPF